MNGSGPRFIIRLGRQTDPRSGTSTAQHKHSTGGYDKRTSDSEKNDQANVLYQERGGGGTGYEIWHTAYGIRREGRGRV